eukprot:3517821-Amphidinium_carterae.1
MLAKQERCSDRSGRAGSLLPQACLVSPAPLRSEKWQQERKACIRLERTPKLFESTQTSCDLIFAIYTCKLT